MKWNHNELAHDLAEHLSANSDRIIWTDMQLGPSGSPRPDVYTINKSYTRFCPIAYECKVSVADFRSDITKGKWQSYLKYASGVIFAVPKGLITKDDVPKGCGLIVRSENCWRMVKGPTMASLTDLPRDFWMKLVIDGTSRSLREYGSTRMDQRRVHDVVGKKYGESLAILLSDRDRAEMHLKEKIEQLKAHMGEIDQINSMQRLKNEYDQLKDLKADLCQLLSLPANAAIWTVIYKTHELLDALNKDEYIQKLRQTITSTARNIDSQLKHLTDALAPVLPIEAPCKPLTRVGESD